MDFLKNIAIEVGLTVVAVVVLPYIVSILKTVRNDKRLANIFKLVEWAVTTVEKWAKNKSIEWEDREDYARELVDKYKETYGIKRRWLTEKIVRYAIRNAVNKLKKTFKDDKEKIDALPEYDPRDNIGDLN